MTPDEMNAVVTRNSVGCVHHKLSDGAIRTSRVRYASDGNALYIPAWTSVESWYAARLPALECHVSEVDWGSGWRYVRLRGQVTPLHPTGAPSEREGWRKAVGALRRTIADLAPTDDLALANFGIVQMDIELWDGSVVVWEHMSQPAEALSLVQQPREAVPSNWANWVPKIPDLLIGMFLLAYSIIPDFLIEAFFFAG